MKTVLTYFLALTMLCILQSCDNEDPAGVPTPGLSIYKTRSDYYNNVHTYLKNGKAYFIQDLIGKVVEESDGKLNYRFRTKLRNGYILAAEDGITSGFLKYTIEDYYNNQKEGILPTMDEIQANIIDTDPFIEYYYDANVPRIFEMKDTARINEIILKGELEKYFKKAK